MKVSKRSEKEKPIDLLELYALFQEEYRNVFIKKIDEDIFIYRSLGRAEYKEIISDPDLSDLDKEDIICNLCLLYPENYDFDNGLAGVPTMLHDSILADSYLDSVESRRNLTNYYRNDMHALENQITVLINEAFPNFDIEEIEKWDTEKTIKYLSRAEWKLHHLRGIPIIDSEEVESYYQQEEEMPIAPVQEEKQNTNMRGGNKMDKLTPQQLEEMRKFQERFPEINVFADDYLLYGEQGINGGSVDTVSPALRTRM